MKNHLNIAMQEESWVSFLTDVTGICREELTEVSVSSHPCMDQFSRTLSLLLIT